MHANKATVGFVTVLIMACCFAFGGFASPAAAKTIVVTILDDTADPPFDADGFCGAGTINDLPGADDLISLREAIIAANNTPGADIVGEGGFSGFPGFAPNLGTGNLLTGEIFQNTATTVTVQDGTPGNTADVTQFKNVPCS
jgi:hypothetical protein